MRDEEARLLELASRVSDGQRIDWNEKPGSSLEEQQLLDELKTLESLASFHRRQGAVGQPLRLDEPSSWAELDILQRIGSGSFGDVYLAWDPRLQREVALKLMRSDDVSAFRRKDAILREGRILARLKHPNVATVHGAAEQDRSVGVWMELIRGRTLAEIVEDQGPLGAREAAGIGIDICRAVAAVHREGLLHRDIKAQNVMRERGGRIVLMDFGLGGKPPAVDSPQRPALSGTPLYMAPELLRGQAATVRSDIYAIGVLLFYLVSGKYPVSGSDLTDLSQRHEVDDHLLLRDVRPDLPSSFVQVVERALAPRPRGRFQTVGEMEQALDRSLLIASGTFSEGPSEWMKGVSRRPTWRALLWLLPLLLAGALAWQWLAPHGGELGKIPIAVVYFENFTRDPELDWLRQGIPDQLVYSLSQSNYLQVRSMDRMLELLTETPGPGLNEKARLRVLAERAKVRFVIGGSVFLDEGRLTVISQVNDLESDSVLKSQKVSGGGADDVFEIVGSLSREIRRALEIESEESPEVKEGVARLKTDSKDAYRAYVQCREMLHGRGYQEALSHCRQAVEEDPDFLHAWDLLANLYDNLGERGLALAALDNAVRLLGRVPRSDQLTVLLRQAQIQQEWNDYAENLEELRLLQPDEPAWPFRLGWHFATHRRDYEAAIREYRQALSKGAEPRVGGYLCFAYLSAGRYPEASRACRRFVEQSPMDASAHDSLGFLLMLRGEYQQARSEFEQALALRPNFSHSLRNLGELDLLLGRIESARDYFDRYLVQATGEKQEKEGRWSMAWFHWEMGRLEAARNAVEAALRQDPQMVKGRWLQGLIELAAGDNTAARAALAALDDWFEHSLSSRFAEYRHDLAARLQLASNRPDLAVASLQRALELGPSDRPLFLIGLGEAQQQAGRRDDALDSYREALRINPRFPSAHLKLARLLELEGDQAAALQHYQQALEVYRQADPAFPRRGEAERSIRRLGGRPESVR